MSRKRTFAAFRTDFSYTALCCRSLQQSEVHSRARPDLDAHRSEGQVRAQSGSRCALILISLFHINFLRDLQHVYEKTINIPAPGAVVVERAA